MDDIDAIVLLDRIISTMNLINVSGKDNLDRLLGCIQALEKVKDKIKLNPDAILDKDISN